MAIDYLAFAQRVLKAQREAILNGTTYRGPGFSEAADPKWHEIERADNADLMRINGDPSHYDTCPECAELRRQQRKDARCAPCEAIPF